MPSTSESDSEGDVIASDEGKTKSGDDQPIVITLDLFKTLPERESPPFRPKGEEMYVFIWKDPKYKGMSRFIRSTYCCVTRSSIYGEDLLFILNVLQVYLCTLM